MWHDLFADQIPLLEKVFRTIAVYALILVIFRIIGKRSISALNTMDFVVMCLLSNVVQNAIIGNDDSLVGGAIGALTLVGLNAGVDRLAFRYPAVRVFLEGKPVDVICDGHAQEETLRKLGMRQEELDHAIRMQNGADVSEVATGVLEPGGQLVLTLKSADQDADQADIAALRAQLDRIEALLAQR